MIDLCGAIVAMFGVIGIFDARAITKKWFSFGDQNQATKYLKFIGFIFTIIGCIIMLYI